MHWVVIGLEFLFKTFNMLHILQKPQNKLWRDMISEASNDLDATKLR